MISMPEADGAFGRAATTTTTTTSTDHDDEGNRDDG
jgi:hypothetical protein